MSKFVFSIYIYLTLVVGSIDCVGGDVKERLILWRIKVTQSHQNRKVVNQMRIDQILKKSKETISNQRSTTKMISSLVFYALSFSLLLLLFSSLPLLLIFCFSALLLFPSRTQKKRMCLYVERKRARKKYPRDYAVVDSRLKIAGQIASALDVHSASKNLKRDKVLPKKGYAKKKKEKVV